MTRLVLFAILVLSAISVAPRPILAVAASCASFSPPSCETAGEFSCPAGQACVEDNGVCACQPLACCRCESLSGTSACDAPCQDATINELECAENCFAAVQGGADCNLTVVAGGNCSDGTCAPTGCCQFQVENDSEPGPIVCVETTAETCAIPNGTFIAGGSCAGGVAGTCIAAALPDGAPCSSSTQCQSTFCTDGVCCNQACDGETESCNAPGQAGICTALPSPAPALSSNALVIALSLLIAVAWTTMRWQRNRQ
jgi:hypothetical protein